MFPHFIVVHLRRTVIFGSKYDSFHRMIMVLSVIHFKNSEQSSLTLNSYLLPIHDLRSRLLLEIRASICSNQTVEYLSHLVT